MTLRIQLRWGGLWIIVASSSLGAANMLMYLGYQNFIIQAVYGIGLTGMILTCTIIHVAQARQSGLLGLLAYLLSVLSLLCANVAAFLFLAEFAGIEGAMQTVIDIWNPVLHIAVYSIFIGLILLGVSVARTGVLPRWGGVLTALGIALRLPSQFAIDIAGPIYYIFTIGGTILSTAGLIWIGWALWSGRTEMREEPALSSIDRAWGAPFVLIYSLMAIVNAFVNSVADLTLFDGITNLLSITSLILAVVILHTAQANRSGGIGLAGFLFTHLGATLLVITAYLIVAQLTGQIDNNRALMASWVDIPVGRYGNYMLMFGSLLFGIGTLRAEVFPRAAGWFIVTGLALLLPSQLQTQDYLFSIFWVIGAILQGIGFGWMGWTLLKYRESTG